MYSRDLVWEMLVFGRGRLPQEECQEVANEVSRCGREP